MKYAFCALAAAPILALGASAGASVVTFELEVNGSSSGSSMEVGDTVAVSLYATVTDNTHTGVDLGLASYGLSVLSDSSRMEAVQGVDMFNAPDGEWAVTYYVPMSTKARGNVVGGAVNGHGAVALNSDPWTTATTRTLLATGSFTAIAEGYVNIRIGGEMASRVFTYDGGIGTAAADSIVFSPTGVPVTVVPEPAAAAMLGLAGLLTLRTRRNRPDLG